MEAKFYGIGVGPGESALMTLKAIDYIEKADVLVLPAKDRESCKAYIIAEGAYPNINKKECIFCPFPMTMDEEALDAFHKTLSLEIIERLDKGALVGFLCIGDPDIYSTYDYIRSYIIEAGYKCETIPGVTSFNAAAALLNLSLGQKDEEIHIIPGSGDIKRALDYEGTLIFMKSGKHLAALKELLISYEKGNPQAKVYAVSNCGLSNEKMSVGAMNIPEGKEYLTIVIVKKGV